MFTFYIAICNAETKKECYCYIVIVLFIDTTSPWLLHHSLNVMTKVLCSHKSTAIREVHFVISSQEERATVLPDHHAPSQVVSASPTWIPTGDNKGEIAVLEKFILSFQLKKNGQLYNLIITLHPKSSVPAQPGFQQVTTKVKLQF